jgi:trehalose/maltose transport system permease protein
VRREDADEASELTRAKVRSAWLFVAPMLCVLALVAFWPLARTIWLSFTDAKLGGASFHYVGLENYLDRDLGLLHDADWWRAVFNTVRFSVISVALETVLGLGIAMVLHKTFPGRGLLRTAVLVPWAIPTVVAARMWHWMLNDQFGVINALLMGIGVIAKPIAWTADPATAMWAVIIVDVWKTTPFMALLILAGLQMLPADCYEAAKVDGVGPFKVFFRITLPLLWPTIMVAVIFRTLDTLRVFDLIYILTTGSKGAMTMAVYARYHLIENQSVGYGSALATGLFAIIAMLTALYLTLGRVQLAGEGRA